LALRLSDRLCNFTVCNPTGHAGGRRRDAMVSEKGEAVTQSTAATADRDAYSKPVTSARVLMQGELDRFGIISLEVERAAVLLREHPPADTTRTMIIVRRGDVSQNRYWFAGAGSLGPVAIVGGEPWTEILHSFEDAAEGLIEVLRLHERPGEICLTGGSAASFATMLVAAMIAERMPGRTFKIVAFSLVTELYRKEPSGEEYYWPYMVGNLRERPDTMAGMRKYPLVRPHLERAAQTPGTDLRVKAFITPLSNLDFHQAEQIRGVPGVQLEEVLTDDYNHDTMAWTMMPARDLSKARAKLLQWMQARNPKWPQRTLETRVDREVVVALEWRRKYPDLKTLFDCM
jgi:hypothetical protein